MLGMNKSIFRRLLFSYLFIILLGLGGVGLVVSFLTKSYIYNSTQEELLRKAKRVNLAIQDNAEISENEEQVLFFLDQSFNARIWIFDEQGKIITTSTKDEVSIGKSVHPSIVEKIRNGETSVNEMEFEGLAEPMISVSVPWGKEDDVYGGIVLHSPVTGLQETVGNVRETILWATLFGILLSTAMVSYLSWSISRPLQKIERAAAKIGMGDYEEEIEIRSPDEIGELAVTINHLAKKLNKIEVERKKLDQIRNDFLANVSHELRTPLTAMQGFLEALQDDLVTDEEAKKRYYDIMYQETLHMNRLIDDLMDLIRLETKEIKLSLTRVNISDLLEQAAIKFEPQAAEKKIALRVTVPDTPLFATADEDRMEQIINNVVKNAVKFTSQGSVTLDGKMDNGFVRIRVKDTGAGIALQDQERIWERFFKADRGRSKNNSGTGLGLAIVKELVELHNGKIDVESELNQGTTFHIWIPAAVNET